MPKYKDYLKIHFSYTFTLGERQDITRVMQLDHLATKDDCKSFIFRAITNQLVWLSGEIVLLEERLKRD
jgi:hypothetical protein